MCAQLTDCYGKPTENFLYSGDFVPPGKIVNPLLQEYAQFLNVARVLETDAVRIHGKVYRIGSVLALENRCTEAGMPSFCLIRKIICTIAINIFGLKS